MPLEHRPEPSWEDLNRAWDELMRGAVEHTYFCRDGEGDNYTLPLDPRKREMYERYIRDNPGCGMQIRELREPKVLDP